MTEVARSMLKAEKEWIPFLSDIPTSVFMTSSLIYNGFVSIQTSGVGMQDSSVSRAKVFGISGATITGTWCLESGGKWTP